MEYTKQEKFMYVILISLSIFIAGVQIGIAHGREIQKQEFYYDYAISN